MIDGLRPYPETKPSRIEWLPILPNGWEIHRAKYSFQEADDRSESGGEELLSVSHKTGVTPRSQKNITMFMAESYEGHKVCRPGDVVVNTMWAWMAAIGVSRYVGIVSPAYGIYRPRTADRFEPKFLDYLLRTEVYRAEYLRSSRGVTTSRLRLYPPDFLNIPFVQPPLDEQRLIVRFLDWHGAQTAKLVRAKKKIIALLNEQKQAIIHRAVTRGLDPNAKLKPSGIPWLGDVPEGWEVKRLRQFARVVNGYPFDSSLFSRDAGHPIIRIRDLDCVKTEVQWSGDFIPEAAIEPGEILIGMDGDFNVGTWNGPTTALLNQRICCVRANDPRHSRYLHFALPAPLKAINVITNSTTVKHLSSWQVERIAIALPPVAQCGTVVEAIEQLTGSLTELMRAANREIALIQEFRTRLIADVVTGKLDVRAAAASLPEVAEPEPIDDLTEGDDLDEALDDAENEEVAA